MLEPLGSRRLELSPNRAFALTGGTGVGEWARTGFGEEKQEKGKRCLKLPGLSPHPRPTEVYGPGGVLSPPRLRPPPESRRAPLELGGRRLGAGFAGIWAPGVRPGAALVSGTPALPEAEPPMQCARSPWSREWGARLVDSGLVPGKIGGRRFPLSLYRAGISRLAPERVSRNRT